jgi:hypothetical protein
MQNWTADITNDPNNDFDLVIEIMYGNTDCGRIQRNQSKELEIIWYRNETDMIIPADWLISLLESAKNDI